MQDKTYRFNFFDFFLEFLVFGVVLHIFNARSDASYVRLLLLFLSKIGIRRRARLGVVDSVMHTWVRGTRGWLAGHGGKKQSARLALCDPREKEVDGQRDAVELVLGWSFVFGRPLSALSH